MEIWDQSIIMHNTLTLTTTALRKDFFFTNSCWAAAPTSTYVYYMKCDNMLLLFCVYRSRPGSQLIKYNIWFDLNHAELSAFTMRTNFFFTPTSFIFIPLYIWVQFAVTFFQLLWLGADFVCILSDFMTIFFRVYVWNVLLRARAVNVPLKCAEEKITSWKKIRTRNSHTHSTLGTTNDTKASNDRTSVTWTPFALAW